jgi:hypothetical protein
MRKPVVQLFMVTLLGSLLLTPAGAKEPAKAKGELKVIPVAKAFEAPADHAGKVGLEGTVAEVEGKEPSFVILTPNPPGSCPSECCAPQRFTVHVPKGAFSGKLPKKDSKVVVVGELKPLTKGFEFTVAEVRQGDKVLLAKAK